MSELDATYTHPTGEHIDWSAWPEPDAADGDGSEFGERLGDGPGAVTDTTVAATQRLES